MFLPVVLGTDERLFGVFRDKKPMRLNTVATIGDGLMFVTYEVEGRLTTAVRGELPVAPVDSGIR
jgi:hypothetical protein